MNSDQRFSFVVAIALSVAATASQAQSTSFTYQGMLQQSGAPYTGSAELQPTLWNTGSAGSQLAAHIPASIIVGVTNGLFNAAFDFGSAPFNGQPLWLQLNVRTSTGAFTTLTPRQKLAPTPYAITAGSLSGTLPAAQLSGTIPAGQLPAGVVTNGAIGLTLTGSFSGAFSGSGAALTELNASQLTAGTVSNERLDPNVSLLGQSIGSSEIADGSIRGIDVNPDFFNTTFWQVDGNFGTTSNTHFIGTRDSSPLDFRTSNSRALRLQPTSRTINVTIPFIGTIPVLLRSINVIGGAARNSISAYGGTIGGGGEIAIPDDYDRINSVSAAFGTIGGGAGNTITNGGDHATISGGSGNLAGGLGATIPGGESNTASGDYSLAAGRRAKAVHEGAFVWADSQNTDFASSSGNQFLIRAAGGVGIGTSTPGNPLTVQAAGTVAGGAGAAEVTARFRQTAARHSAISVDALAGQDAIIYLSENGAAAWDLRHDTDANHQFQLRHQRGNVNNTVLAVTTNGNLSIDGTLTQGSDRDRKTDIGPIDPLAVLEKVAALPLATWRYKSDTQETKHLGPMAQDFHAAFGLNGADDKHIATVDADGVALAAIQGLNEKMNERTQESRARMQKLEAENAELKRRLAALEGIITGLVRGNRAP
jgi:hypothetical protein